MTIDCVGGDSSNHRLACFPFVLCLLVGFLIPSLMVAVLNDSMRTSLTYALDFAADLSRFWRPVVRILSVLTGAFVPVVLAIPSIVTATGRIGECVVESFGVRLPGCRCCREQCEHRCQGESGRSSGQWVPRTNHWALFIQGHRSGIVV
jgi:hypothetical protein